MQRPFLLLTSLVIVTLMACTPVTITRGNYVDDRDVIEVIAQQDDKNSVMKKLGSPTTIGTFDTNIWYYIGQETEKHGILDPQVTDQRIVTVKFDANGKVEYVEDSAGENRDVPLIAETTKTGGNEVTALQQMLGNIGKFNTTTNE